MKTEITITLQDDDSIDIGVAGSKTSNSVIGLLRTALLQVEQDFKMQVLARNIDKSPLFAVMVEKIGQMKAAKENSEIDESQ